MTKTYNINGKEYTEFEINKRCAELLGSKTNNAHSNGNIIKSLRSVVVTSFGCKDYCNNWSDAEPIIDKCWDELMSHNVSYGITRWEDLIMNYNCSKLVAACICFIENNNA